MKEKSEIIYEKNEIINDLREQLIKVESLSVSRIEQLEIELAKEKNNNNHLKRCLTPTLGEKSVEVSNPTIVQSTKNRQEKDHCNINCYEPVMHNKLASSSNNSAMNSAQCTQNSTENIKPTDLKIRTG